MGMIKRKIWALHRPDATVIDATFIIGLECHVEVVVPEPQVITATDGSQWHVGAGSPFIRITTTCDKQESMLKLKYGDDLKILQIFHSIPDHIVKIPEL
jgi:hypothetical protein